MRLLTPLVTGVFDISAVVRGAAVEAVGAVIKILAGGRGAGKSVRRAR
jgi:hypothetical protein